MLPHLHARSTYAPLAGMCRLADLVARAKNDGAPVCVADPNLWAAVRLAKAAAEAKIPTIHAAEARLRDISGHLVLVARDAVGLANLRAVMSAAPATLTLADLAARRLLAGIAVLTGGAGGALANALASDLSGDAARRLLYELCAACVACGAAVCDPPTQADPLWVELSPTMGPLWRRAWELAAALDLPVAATADASYLRREDAASHAVLRAVASKKRLRGSQGAPDGDPLPTLGPDSPADSWGHLATEDELSAYFAECPAALRGARELAASVVLPAPGAAALSGAAPGGPAAIRLGVVELPDYITPDGRQLSHADQFAEMARLAQAGLADRLIAARRAEGRAVHYASTIDRYYERLREELGVIETTGFAGYFLIVADFCQWCRANGVPLGPGRGSAAGSLVVYALGITDVDPIVHGLLFERFLNPERVSMPDIDVDICKRGRSRVVEYLRTRYGAASVGRIANYKPIAGKTALKDVGRALGMSFHALNAATAGAPALVEGKPPTVRWLVENVAALREAGALVGPDGGKPGKSDPVRFVPAAGADPTVAAVVRHALAVEGCVRESGVHASGVVVSRGPLGDTVPTLVTADGELCSQWAMEEVEAAGLVKFDLLGLSTVTHLALAEEMINRGARVCAVCGEAVDLCQGIERVRDGRVDTVHAGCRTEDTDASQDQHHRRDDRHALEDGGRPDRAQPPAAAVARRPGQAEPAAGPDGDGRPAAEAGAAAPSIDQSPHEPTTRAEGVSDEERHEDQRPDRDHDPGPRPAGGSDPALHRPGRLGVPGERDGDRAEEGAPPDHLPRGAAHGSDAGRPLPGVGGAQAADGRDRPDRGGAAAAEDARHPPGHRLGVGGGARALAGADRGDGDARRVRLDALPLTDAPTYRLIARADTLGVFQLGKSGMRRMVADLKPDRFGDVVAVGALYRPGPLKSGMARDYVERKHGRQAVVAIHPSLDQALATTYGVVVYQEQVMAAVRAVAGYSLGRADIVRKIMGKKKPEMLAKERVHFVAGVERAGVCDVPTGLRVWAVVEAASGYSFNLSIDADTLICDTSGNEKRIADFAPGDVVRSIGVSGEAEDTRVVAVHDHGVLDGFSVVFDDDTEVVCSIDHKFLTAEGQRPLRQIIAEDWTVLAYDDLRGEVRCSDRRTAGVGRPSTRLSVMPGAEEATASSESGEVGRALWPGISDPEIGNRTPEAVRRMPGDKEEESHRINARDPQVAAVQAGVLDDCSADVCATRDTGQQGRQPEAMARRESREISRGSREVDHGFGQAQQERMRAAGTGRLAAGPSEVRDRAQAGRLCVGEGVDRGGRVLPLLLAEAEIGAAETTAAPVGERAGARRDAERRGAPARDHADPSGWILLPHLDGTSPVDLGAMAHGHASIADTGRLVRRRIVRVVPVGKRRMYDLEVASPTHNFILPNGVVTSNSHSVSYGMLSYRTAWVKAHYPAEFFASWLSILSDEADKYKKIAEAVYDARDHGIDVLPPCVQTSGRDFTPLARGGSPAVLYGLGALRGLGSRCVDAILAERPFASLTDFLLRAAPNKRDLSALAGAGALDGLPAQPGGAPVPRAALLASLDGLVKWAARERTLAAKAAAAPQLQLFVAPALSKAAPAPALPAPRAPRRPTVHLAPHELRTFSRWSCCGGVAHSHQTGTTDPAAVTCRRRPPT